MLEKLTAAAIQYTPMTDIPFLKNWNPSSNFDGSPEQVFNALFTFSITVGAMLAVFMFIWGGLQLISARDSSDAVTKGKAKMTNAILGLLMLLSTFIVLSTINPQLTELKFLSEESGLDPLQAPPQNTVYDTSAINKDREEKRAEANKNRQVPHSEDSSDDGRYCYEDYAVNNGNPTCFTTSTACNTATNGTRAEGGCSDWQDKKNARRWIELKNENLQTELYCKSPGRGRCTEGSLLYTKEACIASSDSGTCALKTGQVSKTSIVSGGQYRVIGTNETYENKEACDLRAATKNPPTTCSN